jgi:hypothetical protein
MITLTSFVEAQKSGLNGVSAARWAPKFASDWPTASIWAPIRPDGSAIKLRDFGLNPLQPYHEYMIQLYRSRWSLIDPWIREHQHESFALCCWCPFTRTAQAQLERFGTFHCHLRVIGYVLSACQVGWQFGVEHAARLVETDDPDFVSTNLERS